MSCSSGCSADLHLPSISSFLLCCSCFINFLFFFPDSVMFALGLDLEAHYRWPLWSYLPLLFPPPPASPHPPTHRRFLRWWMVMRPWSTMAPTTCLFFLLSFPRTRRRLNSFLPSSCGGVTWSTMSALHSSQIGNMAVRRVIFLSSGYGKYCSKKNPHSTKSIFPIKCH